MSRFIKTLKIITLIYVFLCLLLYIFQRDLLYFPTPDYKHNYDTEYFNNQGEKINVIVLNRNKDKAIMFFGGNAEAVIRNAGSYINNFPNHTIYLINYRGYGGSTGTPNEEAIYSDALHIYDEITAKHTNISLIGRSLGTGVATYLAVNRDIEKMALITPYDSIENVAKKQYPFFPVSFLLKDKFESINRANKINCETLILLASNDHIIAFKNADNLIKEFNQQQIKVKTIPNSGHNSISSTKEFHLQLANFLH